MTHAKRRLTRASMTLILVLTGCGHTPPITSADESDVLTMAASAARKKLPSSFCINPSLQNNRMPLPEKAGSSGWSEPQNGEKFRYRKLLSPDIGKLPDAALTSFSSTNEKKNCRHTLQFEKPEFVQISSPTEYFIVAYVNFSDKCTICGGGYAVSLRKNQHSWTIDPPGISSTWVS